MATASAEPIRCKEGVLNRIKMAAGLQSSGPDAVKGKRKARRPITHGSALVKGKARHPMEDYIVGEYRHIEEHELGLFAVFDGHLGHEVAAYLQGHLFANILKQPEFWNDPCKAIYKAYVSTDNSILQNSVSLGSGGSTAVTALLIDGVRLIVANVGDSRAVICRDGQAIQLSVDHEPELERAKIERRGGLVVRFPGDVARVDGQLAVARAFGDKHLKPHVNCKPDIIDVRVDETDKFLLLASDGIWKVMENQEAVDLVKKVKNCRMAAKLLSEAALARNSPDDISCIIIRFK